MSRTMPSECDHGFIFDWGDFTPCGCEGEECPDPAAHLPEWCPSGCNGQRKECGDG